ncbi:D-galactose-binding periplasmic protein [uncultured delta proteobacterium]|uniref:D-galactose/methyl-galactoside binding periplasmic protein MglB n=1 Tax=uncultured delta proteobacterium TaxID=34034 RepID=A0A212JP79_9DELT|nr:D-galactose-binding periplasmic protein [uncultured delta proteobacterium]
MRTVKNHARVIAVFAAMALFASCLWGCETQQPEKSARTKPLIGILVYRQDDTYIGLVTKAIREALANDAEVEILYAEDDQLVQNEQIVALIKKNVSGFALNIADPQAAATAVDTIKKAGVPVVFFNREPDLSSIKSYGKARFVGTNTFDAGIMQGDIVKELWDRHPEYDKNRDGKCQYIMIQANLDNPEAVARTEYSVKQARANGIAMQQLGETLLCNWDEKLAYETMRLVFPMYENRVELILANNDTMALGAVKALNEHGYNREGGGPAQFIPVVGVDAVPQAVAAIKKGVMSATVVQDSTAMGKTVAAMIRNAVNGKNFLEGVPYPWDESGIAVRIPYSRYSNGQ